MFKDGDEIIFLQTGVLAEFVEYCYVSEINNLSNCDCLVATPGSYRMTQINQIWYARGRHVLTEVTR